MIDHVWTVVCASSVIDQDSNQVSIQNVIDQINIADEPKPEAVVAMPFEVVTLWARSDFNEPSRGCARLSLLSPTAEVFKTVESKVDLSKFERLRDRRRFPGFRVKEPGRYTFRLELQNEGEDTWREVASIPIKVVFRKEKTGNRKTKQE